jgi:carboxynorspermidine decarboxylase
MRIAELRTPCYVVDEAKLEANLKILKVVRDRTGAKILLAQKAFSMFSVYPLIGRYLDGPTASGLYEARLGKEEMGGETHVFEAAYRDDEFSEIARISDYIVFNSLAQLDKFKSAAAGKNIGLRINPQCSTQEQVIYDPCSPFSRLGVTAEQLGDALPDCVSGLHFHTLCEQNSDALEATLDAVEDKFGKYLSRLKCINFGGGHHITRADYDIPRLERCIRRMQDKYGLQVYLEPGEAVALNAGLLITTVLDVVHNGMDIALLMPPQPAICRTLLKCPTAPRLSAPACRMKKNILRIAGPTCLAGDIIGDYSFDRQLKPGDRLSFGDMAIYTMVKNNTFNGMRLPVIVLLDKSGDCRVIKSFGYEDFKQRLS